MYFSRVLQALQQEEIMNVFDDDWQTLGTVAEHGDWSGKISKGLMLYQAFTDQQYTKDKKISSINWHPTIHGKKCKITVREFSHTEILSKYFLALTPSII